MSILRSDTIKNRAGTGAPNFPNGATVTGIVTATEVQWSGTPDANFRNITGVGATFTGVVSYEDVTNVDSVGIITANSGINVAGIVTAKAGAALTYYGDGQYLSGVVAGVELKQAGTSVGTACTQINFASNATLTSVSSGISTVSITASVVSENITVTNGNIATLNLSNAQDHKVTTTGVTTITCTGGTASGSHTVRIVNSGISTVGFSTYFLWPSGATPSLPTANGAISLISFTVQRVGAGGTQLLSGASLNYS